MPRVRATFMVTPIMTKNEKKLRKQEDAELKRQAGLMRSKQAADRKAAAAAHKGSRKKYKVLPSSPASSPAAQPVGGPPPLPLQPTLTNPPTPPPPPEEELVPTAPVPVVGGPTSLKPESGSPSAAPPIAPDLIAGNTRAYRTRASYNYGRGKGLGVPRPWLVVVLGGSLIIVNLFTQDNFTPAIQAVSKKPSAQTTRQPLTTKGTWLSVLGEIIFLIILATIARTSATASKFVISFLLSIWAVWLIFRFPAIAKNKGVSGTFGQLFPNMSGNTSSSKSSTTVSVGETNVSKGIGGGTLHPRQILG